MKGVIAKHKEDLDQSEAGDYIDCYLKEIEKVSKKYLKLNPRNEQTRLKAVLSQEPMPPALPSSPYLFHVKLFSNSRSLITLKTHRSFFFHLEVFTLCLLPFFILSCGVGGLSGNMFMFL